MASPGHQDNNPYLSGEGVSSSNASRTSTGAYFCHQCQSDIAESDVLRVPDLTCPRCNGTFLERIEESQDDPHEFDRVQDNPFAFFGMPPQAGQRGQPEDEFGNIGVGGGGPFNALLQQFFGAMGGGPPRQQFSYNGGGTSGASPASPPLNPAQAAAQAAERRAGNAPSSTTQNQASPGPSVAQPSGASFVYNFSTGGDRPPPISAASSSSPASASSPQPQTQENVPIRNLASFLTEAFGGAGGDTPGQSQHAQGQTQNQRNQASPLQEGPAQQATNNDNHGLFDTNDLLTGMLRAMAGGPQMAAQHEEQRNDTQASGQGTAQATGDAQPGQGGQRTRRVIFGTPGGNGGMTFTFTTVGDGTTAGAGQGGGQPAQGMPFPFPFAIFGGGGEGMPGRMGDYVFSQGALDNIITDLMNQANGRYGPQPAPQEMIDELPKFKMSKELLTSETISDCAVCKDDFEEDNEVIKLPCNHLFHTECIKPWLERNGTCPVCRHQLVEQPEPPRAPGNPMSPGAAGPGQASSATTSGTSAPVSPSMPHSPPIEGGSTMPGGFFPFNLFSFGGASGSANNQAGSSSSSSNNNNNNNTRSSEPQGQPDMDLDLD